MTRRIARFIYKGIAWAVMVSVFMGIIGGFFVLLYLFSAAWAEAFHMPRLLAFFSPFLAAGLVIWAIGTAFDWQ